VATDERQRPARPLQLPLLGLERLALLVD
jgi:hypothetical protein